MKKSPRELPMSRPPLERMMRIHNAIASGDHPNASSLAREFEVSTKTIQRDIDFMRDRMGLPIEYCARRYGFHYTEPVDAFPTLQITEGELFALVVAEKALQQYRGSPFEKRLLTAFKKLERSLPDTVSLNLAEWTQSISFRTTAEPNVDLGIVDRLAQAAAAGQTLRLTYRKPGAATEERTVDPYHIGNVNGDWYLFAHDHLRKAIRTFAPSRIVEAVPTGKTFQRPAKFALERHLRDSFGVYSRQGDYEVRIHFGRAVADYILEKRWHPSQTLVELPDQAVELRMRLGSLEEISRWILGWGAQATVLHPPELATLIRETAAALLKNYPKD
jgi:predicted DNA-binding transcriptional regulator YafY